MTLVVLAAFVFAAVLGARYATERKDYGIALEYHGDWYVAAVGERIAPDLVAVGDRVVAIDGVAVAGGWPWVALRPIEPGRSYEITLERDGAERRATIPVAVVADRSNLFAVWFYFAMGLVIALVAGAIGVLQPERRIARLMCVTWLALAMGLLSQALYPIRDQFSTPELVFFFATQHLLFVAFALGYAFYLEFPAGVPAPGIWRPLRSVLFAWAALAMAGLAGLQAFILGGNPAGRIFGEPYVAFTKVFLPLYALFIVVALFAMCAVVVANYRRSREPDLRRRIRWVVYGSVAGILPYALDSALDTQKTGATVSFADFSLWHWASVTAILLIPLTVSYAVVKHRLFDIPVLVRRGLQYLLAENALRALLFVQVVALGLVVWVNASRTVEDVLFHNAGFLVLLAATVSSLWWHRPLKEWLDRSFFREAYDRERTLHAIAEQVKMLDEADDVTRYVVERLDATLHPKAVAVTRDDAAPAPEGVDLVVPLVGSHDLALGRLLVGERRSEQPYTPQDSDLITAIAAEMASAYERIELRERIEVEQHEKAKLARSEQEARDANLAKSVFLANMSHELRTPLNAILGFAQLLERSVGLSDEQREHLGIIMRSGEHLLGLINDVLSISKIEAGKLTLATKRFDLAYLLQGLEEMFRLRSSDKRVALVFGVDPAAPRFVTGDEGKLRQVLINLLGNAVKFTERGGVALRTSWNAEREVLTVEVEDTGPGIDESERATIFQPFGQTVTGRRVWEGTGLGLAISKTFVELMGGRVSFESEVGRGTTFRVELPLEPAEGPEEEEARHFVRGLEPGQPAYRILVVDDKPENRLLLATLLSRVGFHVREAENGRRAVDEWEAWRPHLVWMDMRMPVLDGYAATRYIRSLESRDAAAHTVIVALTASAFEHDRAGILAAGCDDFVAKPFREETIFDKLGEHIGARFVYEDGGARPAALAAERSAERVGELPEPLRESLSEAIAAGDLESAREVVARIEQLDAPLAHELMQMLKGYRLDELQALVDRPV